MDENEIIKILTDNGGKVWEKPGMRRIYFSPKLVFSMDVNFYGSGNVSSASVNGVRISNSEAARILDSKIWYDLSDNKFHTKNTDRLCQYSAEVSSEFIASMKAKIQ